LAARPDGALKPAARGSWDRKMPNTVTIENQPSQTALPGQPREGVKPAAPAQGLQVTEKALKRIRAVLAKEGIAPQEGGLRLGVIGGGCSGLSYSIKFDTRPRERDRIYEFDGVRIFVDPKSFLYLHGMTLDYEETLMRQGFNFINPNSTRTCGCGSSFSA
jgi:iron-sulfur cluster assembly protein